MRANQGRRGAWKRFGAFLLAGTVMLIPCVGQEVAVNSAATESRILHLPGGYVQPYGSYTLGGEFPGAKAELGFEQEGDRRFARLSFDLTKGAYVGYRVTEKIPAGTSRVAFTLRLPKGLEGTRVFFRVHDSEGQTHLQSVPFKATGEWSVLEFDPRKSGGHWGGANDGVVRLPAAECVLGVETRGANRKGCLDVADVVIETTAGISEIPSSTIACVPSRTTSLFYPGGNPSFRLFVTRRAEAAQAGRGSVDCRITDCDGKELCRRQADEGVFEVRPEDVDRRFGAFALDLTTADGTSNRTWFACLTSKDVKPCPWVGTQCHVYGWRNVSQLVDLLAAAGIGIVRDEPGWAACEQTKGEYAVPEIYEGFVDALLARGIRMNLLLSYGNKLYDNPVDKDAFARFAAWSAEHFKGRIDRYEIWNEPQNFAFKKAYWKKGDSDQGWVEKFIAFTHAADDAIRRVDPDAIVGVTGEDVPSLLQMMLAGGIARAHNAVAFHPYCHRQHRPEREYFLRDFGSEYRALARKHGGANRWCVTEAGWTTYAGKGEYWEVAGGYPRSSYLGQAACIVRMYLAALEAGCDYACQYDFRNDGLRASYTEHNFGLVHHDWTPKPSYAAVAFLTRHVGQRRYVCDLSSDKHAFRVAEFAPEAGKKDGAVLVLWSVEGECEWEVPASRGPWTECRDLFGNVLEPPVVSGRKLRLTERPIYLTF